MKARLLLTCSFLVSTFVHAQTGNVGIGTTSPSDQLHTTGTVRHEGYRGPGTRLVQMDSSGRMIVTGAGEIFSATPSASINNNGCPSNLGVTSTIAVGGNPTPVASSKIAVRVDIAHPATNELRLVLVTPGGSALLLTGGSNGGANFTNTVFTDAAPATLNFSSANAPFTGQFRPAGGTFNICSQNTTLFNFGAIGSGTVVPNGVWTLKVYDASNTNAVTGTLRDWQISFSGPESITTAEQEGFIPKFSEGNLVPSLLFQGLNGNIGIRDPSAPYPLTLGSTGSGVVQRDYTNNVEVGTFANAGGGWLQTYSNHPLLFTTANGGAQMTLNTSGNVGIGISAPDIAAHLHVGSSGSQQLQLENSVALASGINIDLAFKTGIYYSGLIRARGTAANGSALGFYTNASTSFQALQERLTILDNGLVGIGNTNPSYKLDVTGDLRTTSGATIQGPMQVGGVLSTSSTVQISGGSPAAGKVLTATGTSGAATWQTPAAANSGFHTTIAANASIPAGVATLIAFSTAGVGTENFDDGSDFSNATSKFVAPAAGVYHFDASVGLSKSSVTASGSAAVSLVMNTTTVAETRLEAFAGNQLFREQNVSTTLKLAAGDEVWVRVSQGLGSSIVVLTSSVFSGFRVY